MYDIDQNDKVVALENFPLPAAGATLPVVFSNDQQLILSYDIAASNNERVLLSFEGSYAHYFGWPNDESLMVHPLYTRGLGFYGVYEVMESSWKRIVEKRNRAHPQHNQKLFDGLRHFIFTFHDQAFECLAKEAIILMRFFQDADNNKAHFMQIADWIR